MATEEEAATVKDRYSTELLLRPEVSGVGTTQQYGDWVIQIHVDPNAIGPELDLPLDLDGVPVTLVPDGPFGAGPAL